MATAHPCQPLQGRRQVYKWSPPAPPSLRESQQVPALQADSLNNLLQKQSKQFQAAAFVLGPRGKGGISLYLSPLRVISQFPTTLWVSCTKPSCFSKLDVLGSHSSDQVPRVGVPAVEYKPLTLPKALTVYIFESVLFTKL